MAKLKEVFVCQHCGAPHPKWQGQCPECGEWNTLLAETAPAAVGVGGGTARMARPDVSVSLAAEAIVEQVRLATGSSELDRVLGGGLVSGSVTLIGGDPGIGKSTLMLQAAAALTDPGPVLYASGEESLRQVALRARRLGLEHAAARLIAATGVEEIVAVAAALKARVLIVDSIQTMHSERIESAPGAVAQLRECTAELVRFAKASGTAVLLVGHVTKEGQIAGPRVLEHMVDTVLYFEAEAGATYRLLRTVKNRFGSTRELGVFEMDGEGLREVSNPSQLFLSDRKSPVPGTAVSASLEGSRPLLVELQALVAPTTLSVPRRTAVGFDGPRISLIAAILEKHMKLQLAEQDLFFNVAGGLRIAEPACDLAAAAAIWSSFEEKAFPSDWVFLGELGLTGEVRKVPQLDQRIEEARKLGFKTLVVPRGLAEKLGKVPGVSLLPIARVDEIPGLFKF